MNEHPENSRESLQRSIKSIESINTGVEQRAQIVLVILGLKPATDLSLFAWNSTPEEVESILRNTNLCYAKRELKRQEKTTAEYAIAQDEATLQRLLRSAPNKEHEDYGLLMGYPKTAVEAFMRNEVYDGPVPKDIEDSVFKLRFSRDHFTEEFEVVRKWNEAIAQYAPELLA